MKEKQLIKLIKEISNSDYIGDDCAYLPDLGIVITQDSLVEDVHFSFKYTDAYKLGWKSAMVNISDICASGAKPLYMTVALSIPNYLDENFIREFYKGLMAACNDVKLVGGDLTGAEKLCISIAVIGSAKGRTISSKKNAKAGYKIIVSGEHGNSAKGLECLENGLTGNEFSKFINAHLLPDADLKFSHEISENIHCQYAMTDTSDGLADALLQIAKASNVCLNVYSDKIPHDNNVDMQKVLYGGEDYKLAACVPDNILKFISDYYLIGEVTADKQGFLLIDGARINSVDDMIYNHFE